MTFTQNRYGPTQRVRNSSDNLWYKYIGRETGSSTYKAFDAINFVPVVCDLIHQLIEELHTRACGQLLEVWGLVTADLCIEQLGQEPFPELWPLLGRREGGREGGGGCGREARPS